MPRPIHIRKVWKVLEEAAGQLKLALDHTTYNPQAKEHIEKAIAILDKYVLDDMKQAEKCQRDFKDKVVIPKKEYKRIMKLIGGKDA